jgi:ZIP family zinc transporter
MDGSSNVFLLGFIGSVLAALGTGLGGIGVLFLRSPSERTQDGMLSAAAGVMLAATFFSLLLPALDHADRELPRRDGGRGWLRRRRQGERHGARDRHRPAEHPGRIRGRGLAGGGRLCAQPRAGRRAAHGARRADRRRGRAAAVSLAEPLLPAILGLAAGAMLFVISDEIIPETHRRGYENVATFSLLGGFVLMMFLDTLLA